ncbi:baseplate J/gp47 family protein [Pseudovibrio brasiliensis]|uniref:Baseplate J/gp47 family protein n=1 Tax=Pseudovibrio brasiliensis TaxID=1898042 RepID=A0ABX8ARR1_9HYPH|nr:baseplate J/gp47 family protein [Pseudovibrio brasiliensis]QUS57357.1 baseplate J/gp47 family protein [Pseudovibrio brasiliensis]
MSRYAALDLATLPEPSAVVELDYTALLEARLAELDGHLRDGRFEQAEADEIMALARSIAASPARYLSEAGASRELYMNARINAAVRSVLLATATGSDLDHRGAGRGVARLVLDDSDPENIIYEDDESYRARIQLVLESYSPYGPEGAYVYWALQASGDVLDVVPYGPDDNLDPPIPPAEPVICVLSRTGDGAASEDLLKSVYQNLKPDKRRPVGDKLTVISATPVHYEVEAELQVVSAATASLVEEQAQATLQKFISTRLAIGRPLYRTTLAAALKVDGVEEVIITKPASDVMVSPFEAPYASSVKLTVNSITGGWRNV